jgi:CubicO group peptidase (beta-lactamase class C family)
MSLDELLGRARQLVDDGLTPALQLAVARDGEVVAFETFGAATNDSRFCVFSTTKPVVASVVWQLLGEGLLAPGQRIADLIPGFGTHGKDAVTLDQVLLHTAGIPGATIDPRTGPDPAARQEAFARWELEWEPGTRFEYHSASAHWVLVDLIQRVTGLDHRDALAQRVTTPLGLPRVLGIPTADQGDVVAGVAVGATRTDAQDELLEIANDPQVRAAGVPGGGGIMTAATLARFYQALLRNPGGLWDTDVLHDATTHVRNDFDDPMMQVPVHRTRGLVLAGDDGLHQFRQAMFGAACSPGAFGHAGAFSQVAWADPATGTSFVCVKNGYGDDMVADAMHVMPLADLAAAL